MSNLVELADLRLLELLGDSLVARRLNGERLTIGVVEFAPNTTAPSHHHEQEQLGLVISGEVTFTVGDETRDLSAGGMWRIPSNVPHGVTSGPNGAVVLDAFAPVRVDWNERSDGDPRPPIWPGLSIRRGAPRGP